MTPIRPISCIAAAALAAAPAAAQEGGWMQYAAPEEAGFSSAALDAARAHADSVGTAAVMAVHRGRVVAAWGDVARELELHSVRKSLVSALFGTAVADGDVDPDATLAALGIDDDTPLTDAEKRARVADVLAARSGVYLPAAYAPQDQDEERPARGSHPPDTHFFYNNWDFNVAGTIFERGTGEDLYEAFTRRIAAPLGMEDWDAEDGYRAYEPSLSRHPAHTFRMSTRDLARFGWMMLDGGRWDGRPVVPEAWVRDSFRPRSVFPDGTGYGLMWWTYPAGSLPDAYPALRRHDVVQARGTGGQALWIVPAAGLVIVHRGDTDTGEGVEGFHAWRIAERIVAARVGEPSADPRLVPLAPTPLRSQLPADTVPRREVDAAAAAPYLGAYEIAPGAVARVFLFRGRAWVRVPGRGEAELFALPDGTFTIRVQSGVRITFERGGDGRVIAMHATVGDESFRARRLED